MPTVPGLALLLLLAAGTGVALCAGIVPFLAQHKPLPAADIVVIEGWLSDPELHLALATAGPEALLLCSGGPVLYGRGLLGYETYAEVSVARLRELGVGEDRLLAAPAEDTRRDRTWVSALAVRRHLEETGRFGQPVNLVTVGPHARRSFLLYRKAFGKGYPLGIVAIPPQDGRMDRWYAQSAGFKQVLSEVFSLFYTLFFFSPTHD